MAAGERSLADVFQDIIRNVQEIVRSEVRLAKTEFREEAAKARSSMLVLGAGVVAALFATLFVLLTVVDALTFVMPHWAAALVVGVVLGIFASLLITGGLKRIRYIHPTPARTVETLQENVEWAKQRIK